MDKKQRNILFLCTGNSARSIMAEAILKHKGGDLFRAFSAGSHPCGSVNPLSLETLEQAGISSFGAKSKSWDVFAKKGAPVMDMVITVCDNAAGETCPLWPGSPKRDHWPFKDPAAQSGSEKEKQAAFRKVFHQIEKKINAFLEENENA